MKRSARRLAPKSEKRLAYEAELKEVTPAVMARARDRCEIGLPGCWEKPEPTPHHRQRRSQGGPNTVDNLLAVCTHCHRFVHANPIWSFAHAYLLHSYDPIEPLQGVKP